MSRSILDDIRNAMAMIEQTPPFQPEQHLVHPAEYAWIENPVGDPPTLNAVVLAWQTCAIDDNHPEVVALKARVFGETAPKEQT